MPNSIDTADTFFGANCKADQNAWCVINVIFSLEIDNFSLNGQIVPPFL